MPEGGGSRKENVKLKKQKKGTWNVGVRCV